MAEVGIPYTLETPAGSLSFNPKGQSSEGMFLTDVQGLDYPSIRSQVDNRPLLDGAILYDFRKGARMPTLTGDLRYTHGTNGNPNDLTNRRQAEDTFRKCVNSILRQDGLLRWSPTGATSSTSGVLTTSGNEITDTTRGANQSGDARAPEQSYGIWGSATNLVSNGSLENDASGWTLTSQSGGGTIAFVRTVGTHTDNTAQSSFTITPSSNTTVNNTLLMTVAAGGGKTVSSVSDTKGNTWVVDVAENNGTNVVSANIVRAFNASALTTSDTITVTMSGSSSDHAAGVYEFSGILSVSPLDVSTLNGTSTSNTAPTVGPTGATSSNVELVFGCFGWKGGAANVTTSGYTAGFTTLTTVDEGAGLHESVQGFYKITSSTGTQTVSATLSTSSFWAAGIATYKATAVSTATSDTTHAKFGGKSLKVVAPGAQASEGAYTASSASASTAYTASGYVWAPNGAALKLVIQEFNGGSQQRTTTQNFTGTGDWQRVVKAVTTGSPTDTVRLLFATQSTLTTTFWVDGVQLEQATRQTPFTNSSRGAPNLVAPATLIDATTGWFATRVRFGPTGTTRLDRLMHWQDSSTSQIYLDYNETVPSIGLVRQSTSGDAQTASSSLTVADGDLHTIVAAWDATGLYISVDGAPFSFRAQTGIPALASTALYIGSNPSGGNAFGGDFFWAAAGTGTLSSTDLTSLAALGNIAPMLSTLSAPAGPSFIWQGSSAVYTGGLTTDERTCSVRLLEPPQIINQAGVLKSFQISLIAGDPTVYSILQQTAVSGAPSGGGGTPGTPAQGTWAFPFTFPFSFGTQATSGTTNPIIPGTPGVAIVENDGNALTWPTITLFGPYSIPSVINTTTGYSLTWNSNLGASDVLVIDMQAQSILLNGSTALPSGGSTLGPLDFVSSTFFPIEPGQNLVQVTDHANNSAAQMVVSWQNGWVG